MKIIPIANDIIFKAVFTREKGILIKMIKDIFNIEEDISVQDVEIMPGYELEVITKNNKIYRTDILIKLSEDSYVNIEVNMRNNNIVLARNVLQASRIYSQISEKGTDIKKLANKRVRQLNFNTFETFTGKTIEYILLCERDSKQAISEMLYFCNLDIVKSLKMVYNEDEKVTIPIRWGAFMISDRLEEVENILGDDMMSKKDKNSLIKTIKEVNSDKKILTEWMLEDNARLSYEGEIVTAYDDGIEEGIKKGMQKGKKEGIMQVVKNMLKKQFDYNIISELTGKSVNEISMIAKQM